MEQLTDLPNIGKDTEKQLHAIGIYSLKDLQEKGSKNVWLELKKNDSSACLNRLYGLEGAIRNIRWHYLSDEVKKDLKKFYERNKSTNS
jgi:DNA transformation protein